MHNLQSVYDLQSRTPLVHEEVHVRLFTNSRAFKWITPIMAVGGGGVGVVGVAVSVMNIAFNRDDGVLGVVALTSSVVLTSVSCVQLWVQKRSQQEFLTEYREFRRSFGENLEQIKGNLQNMEQIMASDEKSTISTVNRVMHVDSEPKSEEQINKLLDDIHGRVNILSDVLWHMKSRLYNSREFFQERKVLKGGVERLRYIVRLMKAEKPLLKQLHECIDEMWGIFSNSSEEAPPHMISSPHQSDYAINLIETFN